MCFKVLEMRAHAVHAGFVCAYATMAFRATLLNRRIELQSLTNAKHAPSSVWRFDFTRIISHRVNMTSCVSVGKPVLQQ